MLKTNHKKHHLISSLLVLLLVFVPLVASAGWAQDTLYTFVANVSGMFAWLGGMLLNYAITDFVVGFGGIFKTSGLGYSVNSLWTVVRDIFNLTFVFGIVFIGFKMILNSDDSSARKNLISLIMAALLVNFSLYITKVVVDFSNLAAMQLATGFLDTATGKYDVSQSFMNLLGISSLWNVQSIPTDQNGWGFIIGTLIINLVAAFVFFAGGLLLVIRFAVLNIYMILSPVMFLGMVFPGFMSTSRDFWNGFMKRAFFAPAYILMLFLANQVLVNMKDVSGGANMGKMFTAETAADAEASFGTTMPFFILTAVFLIAAIVVGQKMGAQGATTAAAIGRRWTDKTRQTLVNRPAAAVGRGAAAVGGGIYSAAASAPRNKINSLGSKFETGFNKYQANAAGTDKANRGVLQKVALWNGVDRVTRATSDKLKNNQLGTGTTKEAEEEYKRKTMIRANQTTAEMKRKTAMEEADHNLANTNASDTDLIAALNMLAQTMKDMTDAEKEELALDKQNKKDFKTTAVNFTDADIDKFEKSGKFSASEISNIKKARADGFKSIAQTGHTFTTADASGNFNTNPSTHLNAGTINRRKNIATLPPKEAGKLPVDVFLTESMYNDITPLILEERLRNGVGNNMAAIKNAMYTHFRIPAGDVPSNFLLASNPWVKWEKSNSVYAAQFFS